MMNGLPYYKRFPRDFIEGTIGMPFELKGAYSMLLDLIYMQGGELPDEPRYISGLLGCSSKQWTYFRKALLERGKIEARDGFLVNNRATTECELTENLRRTQRDNRSKRGASPSENNGLTATTVEPKPNHTESDTDTDKREAKASLVRSTRFAEFWDAYPHRGARRNRKGAEAKYAAAVRRGVPEQTIIEGARAAHGDRRVREGYARDPTTWLNQEGWADEIDSTIPFPSERGPDTNGRGNAAADRTDRIIGSAVARFRAGRPGVAGGEGRDAPGELVPARR
jgi:uncharacterized protein YdaU (DUF1376 family)